jgi:hypothetical protein
VSTLGIKDDGSITKEGLKRTSSQPKDDGLQYAEGKHGLF